MTDVTDELIVKLEARRQHGMAKYGGTLQPFDGRITELDIEEELLDALVYVTKMRMEREALANLLDLAADHIEELHCGGSIVNQLTNASAALRADVWRIGAAS